MPQRGRITIYAGRCNSLYQHAGRLTGMHCLQRCNDEAIEWDSSLIVYPFQPCLPQTEHFSLQFFQENQSNKPFTCDISLRINLLFIYFLLCAATVLVLNDPVTYYHSICPSLEQMLTIYHLIVPLLSVFKNFH